MFCSQFECFFYVPILYTYQESLRFTVFLENHIQKTYKSFLFYILVFILMFKIHIDSRSIKKSIHINDFLCTHNSSNKNVIVDDVMQGIFRNKKKDKLINMKKNLRRKTFEGNIYELRNFNET